jgi:hypothetical protein
VFSSKSTAKQVAFPEIYGSINVQFSEDKRKWIYEQKEKG